MSAPQEVVGQLANQMRLDEYARAIRKLGKRVIRDIVEMGRLLTQAKMLAGYGNWLPWLKEELGWSDDTALNYMRVYEMDKSRTVRDLNHRCAPFTSSPAGARRKTNHGRKGRGRYEIYADRGTSRQAAGRGAGANY